MGGQAQVQVPVRLFLPARNRQLVLLQYLTRHHDTNDRPCGLHLTRIGPTSPCKGEELNSRIAARGAVLLPHELPLSHGVSLMILSHILTLINCISPQLQYIPFPKPIRIALCRIALACRAGSIPGFPLAL